MTLKTSIEMITSAVASDEFKVSPQVPGTLMDLALTHKVKAALMEAIDSAVKRAEALSRSVELTQGLHKQHG